MRLLLVEDEKRMAQALCEILRLKKYEADHFDSAAFEHGQRLNPEIKGNVTVVGALSVSSPAGHGIVCKDDLVLTGGSFTLVCGGSFQTSIDASCKLIYKKSRQAVGLPVFYVLPFVFLPCLRASKVESISLS